MKKKLESAYAGTMKKLAVLAVAGLLAGCQASEFTDAKHQRPVSADLQRKMKAENMEKTSPILVRIFKEESELEIWKQTRDGTYEKLDTFDICKWSGKLGPKFKEGDRQAPEGFYTVTPGLMNPNSNYYLSFNLGYPNKFDRAHERTGSHLMVHGACSSRGCYAMTDEQMADIYALARDSFMGGQRDFQVQAFPFRMTPENMARHRHNEHFEFWQILKEGYDHFEIAKVPPKIDVCDSRYVFNAQPTQRGAKFSPRIACPDYQLPEGIAVAFNKKQQSDAQEMAKIILAEEESARRKAAIAAFFGNDQADEAPVATDTPAPTSVARSAPASTTVASTPSAQATVAPLALTAQPSPAETADEGSGSRAFGFFDSIFPFGQSGESDKAKVAQIGTPDPNAPIPAAKP
ncbi:transcriptional regulator [Pseudovibrio exalbescens]|uniref:L,D-transpeptidase family protein n=1 Tax=Pseudovibrio exalbescens TaxID=197461 RepID=UPI0023666199|nr:L,D-transpeptidase family protein [Pseudovibrio exalbescens]MDD7909345.1 transcriptional regulator [Pseudovibrio exalbescens]